MLRLGLGLKPPARPRLWRLGLVESPSRAYEPKPSRLRLGFGLSRGFHPYMVIALYYTTMVIQNHTILFRLQYIPIIDEIISSALQKMSVRSVRNSLAK